MNRPWKDCEELLQMFGVTGEWASRFVTLVELGALLKACGSGKYGLGNLERAMMRDWHMSPLVFWANMKRTVRPLLMAGGDTLRALGIPWREGFSTSQDLAAALVEVMAAEIGPQNFDIALQVEQKIEEYSNGG